MAVPSRDRRLRRGARWIAPSLVAACAGALAAGAVELGGDGELGGPLGALAVIGFLALAAVPLLLGVALALRLVWLAWRPHELAARFVDGDDTGGGAPELAAWALVLWLILLGLGCALFETVWLLSNDTAWKPETVSFVLPLIAVGGLLAALALAWPVVRALSWLARRTDARWRRDRPARRSLFTPWKTATALALLTLAAVAAMWLLVVAKQLGPFDVSLLEAPAAGLATAAAVHALIAQLRRRDVRPRLRIAAGATVAALVAACVVIAFVVEQTAPGMTLAIWGDRPLAGLAIDKLFDLDAVRSGVPLAELAPTTAKPGAPHPDIILITIDTVRADHTPPYGGRAEMPELEHLADTGAVFEWAFSPSNVTRRSIPSMVIGLAPTRVRGRVVGWALRVDPRNVLLAERLQVGGYETAGFMCCEGFWGKKFHTGLERGLDHLEIEKRGVELANRARLWLDEREAAPGPKKPLFLWMHLIEPHDWTTGSIEKLPEDQRRRLYDHALGVADSAAAAMLGAFDHRDSAARPIVIVTADHGEGLGEHGQPSHSTDLYDSQTHVPLVISGPGIAPRRINETVSLVDLVPTVMDLAGFVPPEGRTIDGVSVADLATGARAPDPNGGEAFMAQIKDRSNPGGLRAIVRGRFKLIERGDKTELYDTRSDPAEKVNLIHSPAKQTIASELRDALDAREIAERRTPFP